jgi:hypothetical protein
LGFDKIIEFLKKKYSVPSPSIGLIYTCTFSNFDSEFEKVARFRDARGVFDPEDQWD